MNTPIPSYSQSYTQKLKQRADSVGTLLLIVAIFVLGMSLTGCGGGKSTTTASSNQYFVTCDNGKNYSSTISLADAQANCPSDATSTLVTSVPTATYADPEVLAAFNYLNSQRAACGFGKLTQNPQLDIAAANHASYIIQNNSASHYETAGMPGYTGYAPYDRIKYAGYPAKDDYSTSEDVAFSTNLTRAGMGVHMARMLLSGPYHSMVAFHGFRDVGMSFKDNTQFGIAAPFQTLNWNFGFNRDTDGIQIPVASDVQTYPCQGSTGFNYQFHGESPSPLARNMANLPAGHPIIVQLRWGHLLRLTSATMTNLSNGQSAGLLHLRDSSNDPNIGVYWNQFHRGYVLPDQPLAPNTSYQITINGTNNGQAFSRTFTATTGSKDDYWWNGV
jgi:hypothetical protein